MLNRLLLIIKELKNPKKKILCNLKTKRQKEVFNFFNKWHPRYKIIRNKEISVALINICEFCDYKEFYKSINGKNSAAYEFRKASRRGYVFQEISPYAYQKKIYEINTSSDLRQGREMGEWYRERKPDFVLSDSIKYHGVFCKEGSLVAYCMIDSLGELVNITKLMGHQEHLKNGVMYLMLVSFAEKAFKQDGVKYVMYDTWLGCSDGLKKFKKKLGFKPCNVKWVKNI